MRAPCLFIAALLAAAPRIPSQDCIVNLSTGYDQDGDVILAEGIEDDDWTVDRGDGGGPVAAFTGGAAQGFPIGAWVLNDDASLWISSSANATDAPGTYTYAITFFLAADPNPEMLILSGSIATDDGTLEVLINGTGVTGVPGGFGILQPIPFNTGIGLFQSGENVLEIQVTNGGEAANPTGLRLEACVVESSGAEVRTYDISTGLNEAALLVIPNGAPDDDYTLTGPGLPGGPAVVVDDTAFPIPPWLATTVQSKWIGPQADSNGGTGEFRYTTQVTLPPSVDAPFSAIVGSFAADDDVKDVLVNDVSTGIAGAGFGAYIPFPARAGFGLFQAGANTITFVVGNSVDGPTGLRVDAQVTACPTADPPPTIASFFSLDTGLDDASGAVLDNGIPDDNYSVVGPPGSDICLAEAVVTGEGSAPIPPWIGSTALSKWISSDVGTNDPAGIYSFRTTVTLPAGYDAAGARIVGTWTSDNFGLNIFVNGQPTGLTCDGNFTAFHAFPPDAALGLFQTGDNLVEFQIENAGTTINPVGLRVEAVVGIEDPRRGDLSTGIYARGVGPLPGGFSDPRYVVTGPDGSGIGPRAAVIVKEDGSPIPPWIANSDDSQWIGLDADASSGPAGTYTYALSFTLPPEVNPVRGSIAGRWAAAGQGVDILLNGTSLGIAASGPGTFSEFPSGTGRGLFVAGVNVLQFIVSNAAQGSTGLRVEARLAQAPAADPFDISTGFDQSAGAALLAGDTDDDYSVTTPTSGDLPATVIPGTLDPAWIPDSATSGWVGLNVAGGNGEPGAYVYETFVTLTAEQAAGATIVGAWATDDQGTDVVINDVSTGLQNAGGFVGYSAFPADFGNGLFQAGQNSIRFLVTNGGTAANPTGLRVDAYVKSSETSGPIFHRGDSNADGAINITDGIFILNFLFLGGPAPTCSEAANPNDDGAINITDGIFVLNFLFLGGPAPAAPGPNTAPCGPDPQGRSELGCDLYDKC